LFEKPVAVCDGGDYEKIFIKKNVWHQTKLVAKRSFSV